MSIPTEVQPPLFQVESDWTAPTTFPNLSGEKFIALDVETRDDRLRRNMGPAWPFQGEGYIAGVAVATADAEWYFPMRHEGGGNMNPNQVTRWLRDLLKRTDLRICAHNALYDMGWCMQAGLPSLAQWRCTLAAEALIDECRESYSLDACAKNHGLGSKAEGLLSQVARDWGLDPKSDLWRLPAKYVGLYAEQDARLAYDLFCKQANILQKEGLEKVYATENELLPLLLAMRLRGIRVDEERAAVIGQDAQRWYLGILDHIRKEYKIKLDVFSNKSMASAFDRVGIWYPHTAKGNPSFTKEFLETITHPLGHLIREARKASGFRSLVTEGMMAHAVRGRIHCELHSTKRDEGGTVTGRYSSSHPNLQQVPARDPILGPLARSLFLPEEGEMWNKNDYSQQEYRLLVHYAIALNCTGAEKVAKQYENAETDFHAWVAELTGLERRKAKDCNFAIVYGAGAGKLAMMIGCDEDTAREVLQTYHTAIPFAWELAQACEKKAQKRGWVRTILGRRIRFNQWEPATVARYPARSKAEAQKAHPGVPLRRAFTHKALNAVIQGSGAEITKRAMVAAFKERYVPLLQVHDELNFSLQDKSDMPKINELMRDALPCKVPMKVDSDLRKNWAS